MQDRTDSDYQQPDSTQSGLGRSTIVVGVLVLVVVALAGWYFLSDGDLFGGDDEPDQAANGGAVSIPQVPSLRMFIDGGTLYVENDGNVTMSEVEVRDAADGVVCSMGVISPGDRQACEEGSGASGLTAYGTGPQGQAVEDTLGS